MDVWEILVKRTIPFSGAIIWILSLLWYVGAAVGVFGTYAVIRIAGLTAAYIVLALYTDDYRGIGEMFDQVWEIYLNKVLDEEERLVLIRNFLEASVTRWDKYWRKFQEITNGTEPIKDKIKKIEITFKRIVNGEVTFFQGIWIFIYMCYTVLVSNFLSVPMPFDIIVSVGLLLIILFTGGHIKGLGKFLEEIFKTLKYENKDQVQSKLKLLENVIMSGAKNYYFITAKRDELILEKQKEVVDAYNKIGEKIGDE